MQKNSVFYRVFLTVRSSLKYVAFLNVKNPVFYIKKSIFSKSKSPTANHYWGWNNLTKVVQSTNKVWRLHSSVLKKSTFSIKKWIWLELLLFFAFSTLWLFLTNFATLVDSWWVCTKSLLKSLLGVCKYLSEVLSPQILWSYTSYWLRGQRKTNFFPPLV